MLPDSAPSCPSRTSSTDASVKSAGQNVLQDQSRDPQTTLGCVSSPVVSIYLIDPSNFDEERFCVGSGCTLHLFSGAPSASEFPEPGAGTEFPVSDNIFGFVIAVTEPCVLAPGSGAGTDRAGRSSTQMTKRRKGAGTFTTAASLTQSRSQTSIFQWYHWYAHNQQGSDREMHTYDTHAACT